MKKGKERFKIGTATLLCVSAIFFAGCGARSDISHDVEMSGEEWAEQILKDKKAALSDEESAEKAEKAQALQEAQIRHYYSGVLTLVITTGQIPNRITENWNHDESEREDVIHDFALADVDQDGREELLIRCTTSAVNGMAEAEYEYDYNPSSGKFRLQAGGFLNATVTYYDNGIYKVEHADEQWTSGPYTLYRYQSASDSYMGVASAHAWNKALADEWWADGRPFPDELDTDGDGILYNINIAGEEESYEYEDYKYNRTDFDEFFGRYTEGAEEISIEYHPMEYESFAAYTPAYLKLLAEEAGKGRTDTASDLGLLILNEDCFLDAAKELLSEKYGVELEQSEPDLEEWTVGLKDGREVFSFEAQNAGHIGYKGERVDEVTIFGIYPGISVNAAWRKLQAYGFYASPYGEVENCLITGEGFGNVSIWFSAEDNVVTDITVGPFCAFAG